MVKGNRAESFKGRAKRAGLRKRKTKTMRNLWNEVREAAPSELVGIIAELSEALYSAINRSGRKEFEGIRSDVGLYFRPQSASI